MAQLLRYMDMSRWRHDMNKRRVIMFIRALLALYCTAANADELAEPSLAVLPFSSSEMITATEADTLTRLFVAGLINSYAFQVVENILL